MVYPPIDGACSINSFTELSQLQWASSSVTDMSRSGGFITIDSVFYPEFRIETCINVTNLHNFRDKNEFIATHDMRGYSGADAGMHVRVTFS
jgi:hypothetical protein